MTERFAIPTLPFIEPQRYVRAEPFHRFLAWVVDVQMSKNGQSWLDAVEGIAAAHVARFGGSFIAEVRWLERVLYGELVRVDLWRADEYFVLFDHVPVEWYGDEWWDVTGRYGGRAA